VGRVLNAGTGVEISIGDLAALILRITRKSAQVTQEVRRLRPVDSEVMRLVCDSTRLREATGWKPEVELEDGIARTAEWMAQPDNLARYKWSRYTI